MARRYSSRVRKNDHERLTLLETVRYCFRRVFRSNKPSRNAVLRDEQIDLLHCVGGMPKYMEPTPQNVARRMVMKQPLAIELLDRTVHQGYLEVIEPEEETASPLIRLTQSGEQALTMYMAPQIRETEVSGLEWLRTLRNVLAFGGRRPQSDGTGSQPGQ